MVNQLEEYKWKLRIIFIAPEFQGKGIAQKAIRLMEDIHLDITEWVLETPHDLFVNHHIYEKAGYIRTNEITPVNEKLALVHYRKRDYRSAYIMNHVQRTLSSKSLMILLIQ